MKLTKSTVKSKLFNYLDNKEDGEEITALDICSAMALEYGLNNLSGTYLRYLRFYRRERRYISCIDRAHSLYRIIAIKPGARKNVQV